MKYLIEQTYFINEARTANVLAFLVYSVTLLCARLGKYIKYKVEKQQFAISSIMN
jgi:hypothetical protein